MPTWQKLSKTGHFLLQKDTCYTGQGQSSVNYCFRWLVLSASWFDYLRRLYLSIRREVLGMKSSHPLTIPFCVFATGALLGDFLYVATYIVNILFDHLWTPEGASPQMSLWLESLRSLFFTVCHTRSMMGGMRVLPPWKMGRAVRTASCFPRTIGWTKSFSIWWGYLLGRRCKGFLRALESWTLELVFFPPGLPIVVLAEVYFWPWDNQVNN